MLFSHLVRRMIVHGPLKSAWLVAMKLADTKNTTKHKQRVSNKYNFGNKTGSPVF